MESEIKTKSSYFVPASIIAAGFFIALAIIYTNSGKSGKLPENKNLEAKLPIKEAPAADSQAAKDFLAAREKDFILGNPAAPITIVEFADFQCPFCGRFFTNTLGQLKETYVKDGKVKFIYRDFAFLGKESIDAAAAARCAGEQGKFWEYHNYLFNHQAGENNGAFSPVSLKKFSKEIGLNEADFNACFDSKKYEEAIKNDVSQAKNILNVDGTPTSFVNGREIVGAQSFSQFEILIQEALK
ncbi:MAG: DsbA family protein [Candidatus Niyogibacteria bacterium]|nr:DsbA family protein [Candidatus Niyogibacteria bacterium]